MAGKPGPETKLIKKMRDAGTAKYGTDLVVVKHHGGPYSQGGVSDLLCVLNGVFIACEVKSPEAPTHKRATVEASILHALTNGPTKLQREFVADVLRAGGVAGFVATVEQFMVTLACAEALSRGRHLGWTCIGHNLAGPDDPNL